MKKKPQTQTIYRQPKPVPSAKDGGVPRELGVKTTGVKIRGTGAATKGLMARGPMA
jgi:hypothetical protein